MFVNFNILNQLGSPAINSNTFANRPAAGQTGRLFVSTDTFEIYRDNGTTWDLIGGPGSSTITGTGTATQVAYFTSSQAIGSSANLYWDNTAGALGINTATPGAELDVHGTGTIAQFNTTAATGNVFLAIQRSGTGLWRIGDTYNGGSNFFELHNTALANNAIAVLAASNEATFLSSKTYTTGNAIGVAVQHNLTIPNAVNVGLAAIGGLNSNLNLTLGGSTTVANTGRQGLEGSTSISFTGAGTLTMTQGTTVRAFSALSTVYGFNGSAVGTITHLAGLRICFPDNVGSAVNITNNYALLINDQTTGTGTITYTNRWGIYQEGASDTNYFAGTTLVGTTVNSGYKFDVSGSGRFTDNGYFATNGTSRVIIGNGTDDTTNLLQTYTDLDSANWIQNYATNNTEIGGLATYRSRGTIASKSAVSQNDNLGNYVGRGYNGTQFAGGAGIEIYANETYTSTNAGGYLTVYTTSNGTLNSVGRHRFDAAGGFHIGANSDVTSNFICQVTGDTYLNGKIAVGVTSFSTGTIIEGVGGRIRMRNDSSLVYSASNSATFNVVGQWRNLTSGTGYNSCITLTSEPNGEWYILSVNLANNSDLVFNGRGSSGYFESMRLTASQNCLIGTSVDSGQKLYVNGTALINNILTVNNDVITSGQINFTTATTQVAGSVAKNTTYGLTLFGVAGITYDLGIVNKNGSQVVAIPTGTQKIEFSSSIKTGAPTTGTAAEWKLGQRVAAAVVLDATQYIEVEVGGTFYKLAIVT